MRNLVVFPLLVLSISCSSTFTPSGDAASDTGGHLDGADVVPDSAVDPPADAPSDTSVGCSSHMDCLPADYCGPCGFFTCPCTPGEDPACSPHCIPNPCHDGSDPICPSPPPSCAEWDVLTVVGGCFACLNIETCRPWGEPGCEHDSGCPAEEYCEPCATGSCPACEDCVAGCLPHGCPTESEAECGMVRPDCGEGAVGVVRGGCWVCVDMTTCEPITDGG